MSCGSNILIPLGDKTPKQPSTQITYSLTLESPKLTQVQSEPKSCLQRMSGLPPSPSRDTFAAPATPRISDRPLPMIQVSEQEKVVETLPRMGSALSTQALPKLPVMSSVPKEEEISSLMEINTEVSSDRPDVEARFKTEEEFVGTNMATPLQTRSTKVAPSPSTAVFETYEGIVQDKDVEQTLLDSGFIPTEKLLTRDDFGIVTCHFIKTRDKLGHASYVEIDTDYSDGMGFVKVSADEPVMTVSSEASVIPYSMKVGTFEANQDLYGVGFECDNSVCMLKRKDPSLAPSETIFSYSTGPESSGIMKDHPIPFPIVKMSEIISNPAEVQRSIQQSHQRMRNVAFNKCHKDVQDLKQRIKELEKEVVEFDKISSEVSNVLSCTINNLETFHGQYEDLNELCDKDKQKLKTIRFNLQKRHDLVNDHVNLCKAVKERSDKIAELTQELRDINEYSVRLFTGLNSIFTE